MDVLPFRAALRIPAIRRIVLRQRTTATATPTAGIGRLGVSIRQLPIRLPTPLERSVAAVWGGKILIAGGLDPADNSAAGVFALDPKSGHLHALGAVPQAFHDAGGAIIGQKLFVFGGGAATSSDAVQTFDLRTRRGTLAGRLPHPLSDASTARIGSSVYLVGGFDGTHARREILRTNDGRHFSIVGRLPLGLRYPALAAAGGRLMIAGGQTEGGLSARVYSYDPVSGTVATVATLPQAVGHAAAVTAGDFVYFIGGRTAAGQATATVTSVDWRTDTVRNARIAYAAVSDAAAAQASGTTYLVGGWNGTPVATVLAVRPH